MDPALLSRIGLVILFSFLLVITLILRIRTVTRERDEYREVAELFKYKLGEEIRKLKKPTDLINNLVDFALAYYKRKLARGKKIEPANAAMKLIWERLPRNFQKRLAPLGGLANLKVGEHSSS
jgi:hypothetical protein